MRLGQDIKALTGLRGIAAVYVMIFHYFAGQALSNPATTIVAHGYLAVDLFFVLSGFVMALNYAPMFRTGWSASTYITFLGRRIARVYPLYAALTVVAYGLMQQGVLKAPQVASIPQTLGFNLVMVQSWGLTVSLDGPAWSISAEWAAYLLFPFILIPCLFRRAWLAGATAIVSLAIIAVLCALPAGWAEKPYPDMLLDMHEPVACLPVIRCLTEFALGIVAFRASSTPAGSALARSPAFAFAACTALIVLLALPRTDLGVVALFPLLILSLTSDRHGPGRLLASRPIEYMGQLSYAIYLTHDLMAWPMGWVRRSVEAAGFHHGQTFAAVAGVLMTLPCAYLCYHLIERPGRRWLRHVFEGRHAPPIAAEPSAP